MPQISGAPEPRAAIDAERTNDAPIPDANHDATNTANNDVHNYANSYLDNYVDNFVSPPDSSRTNSNPTSSPDPTTSPTLSAFVTPDPDGDARPNGGTQTPPTSALPATTFDKKSISAGQPSPILAGSAAPRTPSPGIPASGAPISGTPASAASSSAIPPSAASSHNLPVVIATGSGASAMLAVPTPPPPAPAPAGSEPVPVLPQAHQMLDSAPTAASPVPAAPIAPGSTADLQMNGQMHIGVHTDTFGAVEIHTVVAQSQVGITVHADRDIARWFSSEMPGLESGLNNSHLNLTGVNFDHGRSGVQTATSFSHGQQRQNFSQPHQPQSAGSRVAAGSEPGPADAASVDILPSDRSAGSLGSVIENHFSVHV